jgi:hypothetical protein
MKAKKVYEFKQGGDPYGNMGIGANRNIDEWDSIDEYVDFAIAKMNKELDTRTKWYSYGGDVHRFNNGGYNIELEPSKYNEYHIGTLFYEGILELLLIHDFDSKSRGWWWSMRDHDDYHKSMFNWDTKDLNEVIDKLKIMIKDVS